jgi:hypothetical protein
MGESRTRHSEQHPFEQFKATMQKLVRVPKLELSERMKAHNEQKAKRRAGRKPTRRKAD